MAKKILVVDDDLFIRDLYKEALTDAGYEVVIAVNGREGLQELQTQWFDLVFLDIVMPEMDGLSVIKELKSVKPEIATGPIIILSNSTFDKEVEKALKLGAQAYVLKHDVTPDKIVATADELTQNPLEKVET